MTLSENTLHCELPSICCKSRISAIATYSTYTRFANLAYVANLGIGGIAEFSCELYVK